MASLKEIAPLYYLHLPLGASPMASSSSATSVPAPEAVQLLAVASMASLKEIAPLYHLHLPLGASPMVSSRSATSVPAPEAVQVLVSLDDESLTVRGASMASLTEIAPLNPILVLDGCSAVSKGGRQKFGNMAGVFQVMAFGVQALDKNVVDTSFMSKLAKLVTSEMISSKIRISSVEALDQMVGLITRTQLKADIPRLVPTILELYKKDQEVAFLATCSLHNLFSANLLSESGPPLVNFQSTSSATFIVVNFSSKSLFASLPSTNCPRPLKTL